MYRADDWRDSGGPAGGAAGGCIGRMTGGILGVQLEVQLAGNMGGRLEGFWSSSWQVHRGRGRLDGFWISSWRIYYRGGDWRDSGAPAGGYIYAIGPEPGLAFFESHAWIPTVAMVSCNMEILGAIFLHLDTN